MQVIGFNFKKILGEKLLTFNNTAINTNIEFNDISKEKLDFIKDEDALKISFIYSLIYNDPDKKEQKYAELFLEGEIALATNKEESKNILKAWKKKEIPEDVKLPLFNLILKKCTKRAIALQDELNLPTHIQLPKLKKQVETSS